MRRNSISGTAPFLAFHLLGNVKVIMQINYQPLCNETRGSGML